MKSIAFIAFFALVSVVSSRTFPSTLGFEFGSYGSSPAVIFHKLDEAKSYVAAAEVIPELHRVPEYTTIIKFLEEGKHYVDTAYLAIEGTSATGVKAVILQTELARDAFYRAYKVAEEVGLPEVAQRALYAAEAVKAAYLFAEQFYARTAGGYGGIRSLIPGTFSEGLYDYPSSTSWGYSDYVSRRGYLPYSSTWFSGSYAPYSSYFPYSSLYRSGSIYGSYLPKTSIYGSSLYPYGTSSSIYGTYWPYSSLYGTSSISGLAGKAFI